MPYLCLHELLPELAQRETRKVAVVRSGEALPVDEYALVEMFCDEQDCDCRRVMWQVQSLGAGRVEAVGAYGWESVAFYRRWAREDDPLMIEHLKGPVLNVGSRATELAPAALAMIKEVALADPDYMARVQQHYRAFRAKVAALASAARAPKIGRNERCPCGSGRKWKVCCGRPGAGSARA